MQIYYYKIEYGVGHYYMAKPIWLLCSVFVEVYCNKKQEDLMNKMSLVLVSCLIATSVLAQADRKIGGPAGVWTGYHGVYDHYLQMGEEKVIEANATANDVWAWHLGPENRRVVDVKYEYVVKPHPAGMMGVGGNQLWTVKAVGEGTAELILTKGDKKEVYRFIVSK